MFVPTVLLEESARTFQDALDKLHEDQSAAEYVEYLEAFKKLLANYHTTVWTLAADAALALATSATPASSCSCCCSAPRRGRSTGLGCRQSQNLRNKSRCLCLIGFHAKLSSQLGSGTIWASELTIGLGLCVTVCKQFIYKLCIPSINPDKQSCPMGSKFQMRFTNLKPGHLSLFFVELELDTSRGSMMTRWQNKEVELEAEIRRRVILVRGLPVTARVAGGPGPGGAGPFEPQSPWPVRVSQAGTTAAAVTPAVRPSLALPGSLRLTRGKRVSLRLPASRLQVAGPKKRLNFC